jgi:hypothetical protein
MPWDETRRVPDPESGATDMVDSSVSADAGKVPDNVMPRSYGPPETVARLCAQAAIGNLELLRILLRMRRLGESRSPAATFDVTPGAVSTMRRRRQNAHCAASAHNQATARAAP